MVAIFKSFNLNNNFAVLRNNQYRKTLQAKELELILFHPDYKQDRYDLFNSQNIKPIDIVDFYLDLYKFFEDGDTRWELSSLEAFEEYVIKARLCFKYKNQYFHMFDVDDLVLKRVNDGFIIINDKLLSDD